MRPRWYILSAFAALLAVSGLAAAQECPECDEDGEPGTSGSYSSVDTGYISENEAYLVDTDMSFSEEDDPKGVWSWFSLCITAIADCFEEILGFDTGFQGNVEVYESEHGTDLDATFTLIDPACDLAPETCTFSFDDSELGHLDDATWQGSNELHEMLGEDAFTEGLLPADLAALDGTDVDQCVQGEGLAPC